MHHKIYNRRTQVSFANTVPESLDSRLRGNDVRVVELRAVTRRTRRKSLTEGYTSATSTEIVISDPTAPSTIPFTGLTSW